LFLCVDYQFDLFSCNYKASNEKKKNHGDTENMDEHLDN